MTGGVSLICHSCQCPSSSLYASIFPSSSILAGKLDKSMFFLYSVCGGIMSSTSAAFTGFTDIKPIQINMGASPDIGKLVEALAAAQSEFLPIVKTKENPYFKSKYADLEDIISATRPALAKNGLVVFQLLETAQDGKSVIIHTKLAH